MKIFVAAVGVLQGLAGALWVGYGVSELAGNVYLLAIAVVAALASFGGAFLAFSLFALEDEEKRRTTTIEQLRAKVAALESELVSARGR